MPAAAAATAAARRAEPLDELTLRRAQHGDERAWRALIERYRQPVHALIWRLLAGRARHRVEDLVQETFVRVLRALPGFDPAGPASLSTWMLTIAARLALNELRRPEAAPLAEEPVAPGADLPDAQRAVFVLREYHDLDYAEIAAALELDPGTVKSRLSRARAALRAHLCAAIPELAKELS